MERKTVTLVKGNQKRQFSEAAAKIATKSLGWSEIPVFARPSEIGKRTGPPLIPLERPIKLKEPYPGDASGIDPVKTINVDHVAKFPDVGEAVTLIKEKKVRKAPVKSKAKK